MSERLIVALDGHDGAGKTTLAIALAAQLDGVAIRPFAGKTGSQLLAAGEAGDVTALLDIGHAAIEQVIAAVPEDKAIVLDRAWMTVASFVPESETFFKQWRYWIPTALCWADLDSTLSRLSARNDEQDDKLDWHQHYLSVYCQLALRSGSAVIRTDQLGTEACLLQLIDWAENSPETPCWLDL